MMHSIKKPKAFKTKIERSIKAISPVIATLLMIAIAVVASLVAYAWVMGYMSFTTNNTGKAIALPSFSIDSSEDLNVYVQNVGQGAVTISAVYVDDTVQTFTPDPNFPTNELAYGETAHLVVPGTFDDNAKLNIKVTTTDGTFMQITGKATSGSGLVGPTNHVPVAADDSYSTTANTPFTKNAGEGVLANDNDPDNDPITAVQVTNPAHGTISFTSDGAFTYNPETDYGGPDSFTYKANDGQSDSNAATVSITVNPGSGSFGYKTIGGASAPLSTIRGSRFTCNSKGTATAITANLGMFQSISYRVQAALYSSNGQTRLGVTEEKTLTQTDSGWVSFNFIGTKPTLTASTDYVLVIWASGTSEAYLYYDQGTSQRFQATGTYPNWPASVTDQFSTRTYSIYCDYSIP